MKVKQYLIADRGHKTTGFARVMAGQCLHPMKYVFIIDFFHSDFHYRYMWNEHENIEWKGVIFPIINKTIFPNQISETLCMVIVRLSQFRKGYKATLLLRNNDWSSVQPEVHYLQHVKIIEQKCFSQLNDIVFLSPPPVTFPYQGLTHLTISA